MEQLAFSKSLILDLDRYFQMKEAAFVLDTEEDINLLKEALHKIKTTDDTAEFYAVTYPMFAEGMIYSDNILVRTKLDKDTINSLFLTEEAIQPCSVELMTEEEMESAEWIDLERATIENEGERIYSVYWD